MSGEPRLALSILNCTFETLTMGSEAVAERVTMPESVALAAGAVMETVGGVVSCAVVAVISPLVAISLFAATERTRKWYRVPGAKLVTPI